MVMYNSYKSKSIFSAAKIRHNFGEKKLKINYFRNISRKYRKRIN
jgi:hypothetical protein